MVCHVTAAWQREMGWCSGPGRSAAIKKNLNYISDTESNARSLLARNAFKLALVYIVETNWQFLHSKKPRKLLFSVSSQPVITKRTTSYHPAELLTHPTPAWTIRKTMAKPCRAASRERCSHLHHPAKIRGWISPCPCPRGEQRIPRVAILLAQSLL